VAHANPDDVPAIPKMYPKFDGRQRVLVLITFFGETQSFFPN
jgi:hypothetical protein